MVFDRSSGEPSATPPKCPIGAWTAARIGKLREGSPVAVSQTGTRPAAPPMMSRPICRNQRRGSRLLDLAGEIDGRGHWLKRCPNPMPVDSEVEIRPIFLPEDCQAYRSAVGAVSSPFSQRAETPQTSVKALGTRSGRKAVK